MATHDDSLKTIFDWARTALNDNRGAVAAELLTAYVQSRPEHGYAVFLLGESLREIGRAVEAERVLSRALDLAPPNGRARIMASIARVKGRHGSLDDAEKWFRSATDDEIGAQKGWIWIMRGANLAYAGRFEEAAACHERAAQMPGDPDEAFLNLGYVRRAQGRYADAIDAFRKALEITPDYREAQTALEGLVDIFRAIEFATSVSSDPCDSERGSSEEETGGTDSWSS